MKNLKNVMLMLMAVIVMAACSKSTDPAATSTVGISMTASSTGGTATINGRVSGTTTISLTDVKVNVKDIKFDFDKEDDHFKHQHDSAFVDDDHKLVGPYIVDLLNAGSFVDTVVIKVTVPNAMYERVSFRLAPSAAAGDMNGKSILITGKIDTVNFVFWHDRNARFGAKLADSTSLVTTGSALTVAIQLELDKILSSVNGGANIISAQDGNGDGTITIDPLNTDGNKELADKIMELLSKRTHCKREAERH